MPESSSQLPPRLSLEQLKKQAKELLRDFRSGDPAALARIRAVKPGISEASLADAQFALAREAGFASWPRLKRHLDVVQRPPEFFEALWGAETWPLFTEVYEGRAEAVRQRLNREPMLVRAQYAYLEPLHYAVLSGRAEMVQLLLEAGGDPRAPGWSGKPLGDDSPLARAADRERSDLVSLMTDWHGTPLPPLPEERQAVQNDWQRLETAISMAANRGDKVEVVRLLDEHPELATAGLYEAVHQGFPEIVRLLLDRGARVDKPFRFSCWYTPLMHALRYEEPRWDIAEMLLSAGLSPDDRSGMGIPALSILASQAPIESVAWLLDKGADIHQRDLQFDSTPIAWAARLGRRPMVEFLLSRGASRRHPDDESWATPSAWARRKGFRAIAAFLDGI